MRSRLPKERVQGGMSRMSGIVEYEYSNYDIKRAEADYAVVSDELARAQNALDAVNSSKIFFVELEWVLSEIVPLHCSFAESYKVWFENLDNKNNRHAALKASSRSVL